MSDATSTTDLELAERFAPVVRFTEGEYFLPISIDEYLTRCRLMLRSPSATSPTVALDAGEVDRATLVSETLDIPGQWSLQFVQQPFTRRELARWRIDSQRPRFSGGGRLDSVGVFARLVDAFMRATLLVRGRVASGVEGRAETALRSVRADTEHRCYVRVLRQDGWIVVQYWFFYAFNDWRSRVNGVNDHEADWEQVTVYAVDAGDEIEPRWVVFSAHDEVGDDLRRRWDDPDLTRIGDRPVVHAGLGSHSGAYLAGDYLVTVDRAQVGGLYRLGRKVARLLLPWTRTDGDSDIGLPYIDYARGDGERIGEGPRSWSFELIDDATPWVAGYVGLWGADTEDPFGGERGPAGPRYERDGRIRASWGDPVGWAGLAKVAPDAATRRAAIEARVEELDDRLRDAERQRASIVAKLRGAATGGAADEEIERLEAELADNVRQATLHVEERERARRAADEPPRPDGPHDHLSNRKTPLEPVHGTRARVLRLWAAISTPLVLAVLALLVLPLGSSVTAIALGALVGIFAIEALARRHLLAFLATVVVVAVGAAIVVGLVIGLVREWRLTLAATLAAGGVAIAVFNLSELRRR